jgi:hypothetical protein
LIITLFLAGLIYMENSCISEMSSQYVVACGRRGVHTLPDTLTYLLVPGVYCNFFFQFKLKNL